MIPAAELHRLVAQIAGRLAAGDITHEGGRLFPEARNPATGDPSPLAPFAYFVELFGIDTQAAATLLRVAAGESYASPLVDHEILGIDHEVVVRWELRP
jgi:hypothetical protein